MNVKGQMSKVKCFVGLSGGVDSSVAATLLVERGFDVIGVFIKVWTPDFIECTWKQDRLDAMRVCAKLNIPFRTLNLETEYKREVVDYMIREYRMGRTPNPDVMCNQHVKFGAFFDWAMKNGADYVATGHYARIRGESERVPQVESYKVHKVSVRVGATSLYKPYKLLTAKDTAKDQSYFLWTLTQKQLSRTLFPIGEIKSKQEVRKLAEKFGLLTATKKDSQGLCFLGKIDLKEFLKHFIKERAGKVLDTDGKVIGHHPGVFFFTLGERHGFTITAKTPTDRPYFIVAKNLKSNTLTVANKIPAANRVGQLGLKGCRWSNRVPQTGEKFVAVLRYHGDPIGCTVSGITKSSVSLSLEIPVVATPGQSVVLYRDEVCVGGGIIK